MNNSARGTGSVLLIEKSISRFQAGHRIKNSIFHPHINPFPFLFNYTDFKWWVTQYGEDPQHTAVILIGPKLTLSTWRWWPCTNTLLPYSSTGWVNIEQETGELWIIETCERLKGSLRLILFSTWVFVQLPLSYNHIRPFYSIKHEVQQVGLVSII